MSKLTFGYNAGLPEGVRAAWGCRLIVQQDGYTDFLGNRAATFGEEADLNELFAWLDGDKAFAAAREKISGMLRSYTMRTREAEELVIHEDDKGIVVGNTNASFGYLYVAAYLKAHVPAEVS